MLEKIFGILKKQKTNSESTNKKNSEIYTDVIKEFQNFAMEKPSWNEDFLENRVLKQKVDYNELNISAIMTRISAIESINQNNTKKINEIQEQFDEIYSILSMNNIKLFEKNEEKNPFKLTRKKIFFYNKYLEKTKKNNKE